ncbi:MAG: hypothetical protein RLZZ435_2864 [Cyanobacteriota bacterium]|jgi:hypothetical protein
MPVKIIISLFLICSLWLSNPLAVRAIEGSPEFTSKPQFYDSGQQLGRSYSKGVSLGDLDQDGDIDAVVINNLTRPESEWSNSWVWFNNGAGSFAPEQPLTAKHNRDGALGDLNGDGYLDVVFATRLQGNETWLNDRSGHFQPFQVFGQGDDNRGVALGDLNGDGSLDVVFGSATREGNSIWLNNGQGYLEKADTLGQVHTKHPALGDLDGDGDLDLVFSNAFGTANGVWFNDGQAHFSLGQKLGERHSFNVAIGDVDQDQDLDIVFANGFGQGNTVWLNDGQGVFAQEQSLGSGYSFGVQLFDLDRDGDLDAIFANALGEGSEAWENDGTGHFSALQFLNRNTSSGVEIGDINGNDSPDVIFTNFCGRPDEVWLQQSSLQDQEMIPSRITEPEQEQVIPSTSPFQRSQSNQILSINHSYEIELGDIDEDGDLDAIFGLFWI